MNPSAMAVRSTGRIGSFCVSSIKRDQEIAVISSVSLLIAAAIRNSDWSDTVSVDKSVSGAG